MSSQEDLSQLSQATLAPAPEFSVPRTPSPAYASLPDHLSSPSPARALSSSQASRIEHTKYESPPETISMTPPPSSQPHQVEASMIAPNVRTPTPPMSLLSSPPPTNLAVPSASGASSAVPTPEQVAAASPVELRSMVNELSSSVKAARMAEAHYKLQHSLLSIETSEAAKRMEVEHEMTRREVDLLRSQEQQRQNSTYSPMLRPKETPQIPSRREYELEMFCKSLQTEQDALRRRLRSAKKLLLMKDDENTLLAEENQHLRRRIKDNREHLNRLRGPGGIYEAMTPRTEPGNSQRNTPRHIETARPGHPEHRRGDGEDTFAALLLADQVLSQNQDNASAPTTPIRNRPSKHFLSHTRGTHSLSSFPSTPQSARRDLGDRAGLIDSVSSDGHEWHRRFHDSVADQMADEQRRREDRDSTISASDNSDDGEESLIENDRVHESGASQTASNMLRHAPPQRLDVVGTPATAERSSGLLQSKLFGQVKKPGYGQPGLHGKRKAELEGNGIQTKRSRVGEGVGLGIGGWVSPRR